MLFCTLRGDVGIAPYETRNAGSRHKAVERDVPTVAGESGSGKLFRHSPFDRQQ